MPSVFLDAALTGMSKNRLQAETPTYAQRNAVFYILLFKCDYRNLLI